MCDDNSNPVYLLLLYLSLIHVVVCVKLLSGGNGNICSNCVYSFL